MQNASPVGITEIEWQEWLADFNRELWHCDGIAVCFRRDRKDAELIVANIARINRELALWRVLTEIVIFDGEKPAYPSEEFLHNPEWAPMPYFWRIPLIRPHSI